MGQDLFNTILHQCRDCIPGLKTLFLHKEGEPLLDPALSERITEVRARFPELRELAINTNAQLLDEPCARKLLEAGINTVYISLDSMTPQIHQVIRHGLHWETVIRNIEGFIALRNQSGASTRIILQMTVGKLNRHEVDYFRSYWTPRADDVYIKTMHSYLDGKSSMFVSTPAGKQIGVCSDPWQVLVVHVDGGYGLCCWDYNGEMPIGMVSTKDALSAFNGSIANMIRDKHRSNDCYQLVPCNRCQRVFGQEHICSYDDPSDSMKADGSGRQ